MQHHCTHARRQYTIPSTNSGEPREGEECTGGGVRARLAGQLKIFLGGRAGVPCALCALPARLGVSAHLGAPSLSGKRITAMYEARCHVVRNHRTRNHHARHHMVRHHSVRNHGVRSSPGHTSPLMTLEYPSRVSTHHALHVAHHATPAAASRLSPPRRVSDLFLERKAKAQPPHRLTPLPPLPLYRNGYLLFAPPPGPRLVRGDMHRDMHALPDREGAPPSRFRVRVLRVSCGRVLCQQRGAVEASRAGPRDGSVHCTASTALPQRPDASSVSGQRSVCALCCASLALRIVCALYCAAYCARHSRRQRPI